MPGVKVDGATLGCRGERAVEPPRKDVTGSDLVVCRHYEMRERGLRRTLARKAGELGDDTIWA
jgi:hypothetical protein